MCHAWITHGTVSRAYLTVSRLHYTWSHLLWANESHLTDEARAMNVHVIKNACKPIWHVCEPVWRLKRPFLNRDMRNKRANRRTEHGDRSTYQTEHFKHIPVVLHMKIMSWII